MGSQDLGEVRAFRGIGHHHVPVSHKVSVPNEEPSVMKNRLRHCSCRRLRTSMRRLQNEPSVIENRLRQQRSKPSAISRSGSGSEPVLSDPCDAVRRRSEGLFPTPAQPDQNITMEVEFTSTCFGKRKVIGKIVQFQGHKASSTSSLCDSKRTWN